MGPMDTAGRLTTMDQRGIPSGTLKHTGSRVGHVVTVDCWKLGTFYGLASVLNFVKIAKLVGNF